MLVIISVVVSTIVGVLNTAIVVSNAISVAITFAVTVVVITIVTSSWCGVTTIIMVTIIGLGLGNVYFSVTSSSFNCLSINLSLARSVAIKGWRIKFRPSTISVSVNYKVTIDNLT